MIKNWRSEDLRVQQILRKQYSSGNHAQNNLGSPEEVPHSLFWNTNLD